jgi:hypothetical protein
MEGGWVDLFGNLKKMISSMGVVAIGALGLFVCGATMAFFLSPQAALEWRRIEALPHLDASGFEALRTGTEAALTGTLKDNDTLTPDGLVAYQKDIWDVPEPSESSSGTPSKPSGTWENVETKIPALTLEITGGAITTQQVGTATLSGTMHTTIEKGKSTRVAETGGEMLPDQSIRIQGFANDDLVTIVGKKSTAGALIPDRVFGGDRTQLVDEIHIQAQTLFATGVGMMICAPIFLGGGILFIILGRRRGMFE